MKNKLKIFLSMFAIARLCSMDLEMEPPRAAAIDFDNVFRIMQIINASGLIEKVDQNHRAFGLHPEHVLVSFKISRKIDRVDRNAHLFFNPNADIKHTETPGAFVFRNSDKMIHMLVERPAYDGLGSPFEYDMIMKSPSERKWAIESILRY